jgi:hydrogenase maturation protease
VARYIVGLGNYSRNDDGIGLRIVEFIIDNNLDSGFQAMEAGNDGMQILNLFNQDTEKLLVVDCALMGKNPGEYLIFKPDDVDSKKLNENISTHEGDILKLIALGQELGYHIPDISIFAIEPASLEMDMALSEILERNFEMYVKEVLAAIGS